MLDVHNAWRAYYVGRPNYTRLFLVWKKTQSVTIDLGANMFDAFRKDGLWPTYYPSMKSAVTVDVVLMGILFSIAVFIVSFTIIVPGFAGKSVSTIAST